MKPWSLFLPLLILAGCITPSPTAPLPVGVDVGNQAPDFSLVDTTGETVTLSEYRNQQHIVLVFHTGSL